jgi:hypothetical protein
MTSQTKRWAVVAVTLASLGLAGCPCGPWNKCAADLCGVGASMCASLASAIPADASQLNQAAGYLTDAQTLLNTWSSTDGGMVAKIDAELSQVENIVNTLPGLTTAQKTTVDVVVTTIEEAIGLVASNNKTPTLSADRAKANAAARGVTKPMSAKDLKKEFNKQAPGVGAHSI